MFYTAVVIHFFSSMREPHIKMKTLRKGQQENRKERKAEGDEEQCGRKKAADGAVKREIKLYHAM